MSIKSGMNPILILVGSIVGLIVLGLLAGLSLTGANNSANLVSATGIISQALPILGIGIFVGLIALALKATD